MTWKCYKCRIHRWLQLWIPNCVRYSKAFAGFPDISKYTILLSSFMVDTPVSSHGLVVGLVDISYYIHLC